jgi:hypothetical protein
MTSLAQLIVEWDTTKLKNMSEQAQIAINNTRAALGGFGGGTRRLLENLPPVQAEKFVFQQDVFTVVDGLIKGGHVDYGMMVQTLRLPLDFFWMEWPDTSEVAQGFTGRQGVLVDATMVGQTEGIRDVFDPECPILIYHWASRGDEPMPLSVVNLPAYPLIPGRQYFHIPNWTLVQELNPPFVDAKAESERMMDELQWRWEAALFLLCTPRVSELRDVTFAGKLQKARQRRNKPPLLEYKQVSLTVGVGTPTYARSSTGLGNGGDPEVYHKRLHQVMGHFRTYTKDRETPHIAWVPPHWRGDPELGVVLHHRNVKLPTPKPRPMLEDQR